MKKLSRRDFIRATAAAAFTAPIFAKSATLSANEVVAPKGKRIGMVGLDTGHCGAFTGAFNSPDAGNEYLGYKVVVAYPEGTEVIEEWKERIPSITEEVRKLGAEIVPSMDELLKKSDVVLMTCIDGNRHLDLALPILKARKPLFIDKPFAASLSDAYAIVEAAAKYDVPLFSSSSLRYMDGLDTIAEDVGGVLGAQVYSPCSIEEHHPDLFWYGIHGVEILYTIMGTGCKSVQRTFTEGTDCVTGVWEGDRIATYRGIRKGPYAYGATVFGEKKIITLDKAPGYEPLLVKVAEFYDTLKTPVPLADTLELFAFMEAADVSKKNGGKAIDLEPLMKEQKAAGIKKLEQLLKK